MNVCFYFSSDVQFNVKVIINCISGLPSTSKLTNFTDYSPATHSKNNQYECFIEAALFQKGMRLGLPVTCSYKQFNTSSCKWNEIITFPVRICDVSRDSQIVFTIYAVSHSPNGTLKHIIGGVTLPLFEQRILRFGHYKLRIREGYNGDGSIDSFTLFTKLNRYFTVRDQIQSKIMEKTMKDIPKVSYLDALTNRRLNRINQENKNNCVEISDTARGIYLYVTMPNIGYKVVFQERSSKKKVQTYSNYLNGTQSKLLLLSDPETKLTNPVLEKNNKLSQHLDLFDEYDVRPTVDEQKRLQEIIKLFDMSTITENDKLLLWKYRKYLMDNKNALTKFLRIINQSNENEVEIAVQLMDKWAPIDVSSALHLLSGHFTHSEIRKHGINVLRNKASDSDLELYIMQLVQAIRFESFANGINGQKELSELERFLLDRCLNALSYSLLNFLYWSVVVATEHTDNDNNNDTFTRRYIFFLEKIISETQLKRSDYFEELLRQKWLIGQLIKLSEYIGSIKKVDDKKKKLRYTISNDKGKFSYLKSFEKGGILMPLRPNIRVIGIEGKECSVFRSAMAPLRIAFRFEKDTKYNNNNNNNNNNDIDKKNNDENKDDNINVNIDEDEDDIKLQRQRTQLTDLDKDEYYMIIWKNGDDLRRDQLIIQMIHLMDNLLREVNLNLNLTPYPVLATGIDSGMIEFVPDAPPIGGILQDYNNSISKYFDIKSNGKKNILYKMQNIFTKSLAGYCVITYILGVGDRHLDNILLTSTGYLFHIDFGYIYGEEPPMKSTISPKIRIIKQMIDVMSQKQYEKFQKYIISTYSRLRKMAPLILNLLSLIGQGSMQIIEENVRFVYSRFSLEINEDLAATELLRIVEEAANSIWTALLIDAPHNYRTKHK